MIKSYEDISQMLGEIGPELEVEEIAAFEEEQSWMIAIDDETSLALSIDYDAPSGKLVLVGNLGPPPDDQLLGTYEYLLAYNLAWSQTGGVRMALDPTLNEVVFCHLLPQDACSLGSLTENSAYLLKPCATGACALSPAGLERKQRRRPTT